MVGSVHRLWPQNNRDAPVPTALDQTNEYKVLVNTQKGARLMEAFTDLKISLVQQIRICPLLLFGLGGGLLW